MSVNGAGPVETPVLIVGGGAAGLMTSLLLGQLGVPSILVERHPGTSIVPKAHIIHARTMEIFRQAGLGEEIRAAACPPENFQRTSWYTSLGGDEAWDRKLLTTVPSWGAGGLEDYYESITAEPMANLPQHLLEPILRMRAEQLNGPEALRFGQELVGLCEDGRSVLATISDRASGDEWQVRADWVVGADGGKTVGDMLGVRMEGPAPFVDVVSLTFEADFSPYLQEDDSLIRLFLQPNPDGTVRRFSIVASGPDPWDRHCRLWRSGVISPVDGASGATRYTEDDAIRDLRQLFKLPDLEITDMTLSQWLMEAVLADRFRVGRVFLVGDAAHRHSPMGGLGLNTGIQDAHNIAWKLAAVVRGHAGPALLDSYEPERRPVGRRRVDFATFSFFNHLSVSGGFGMLPGASIEHNRGVLESLFSDTEDGATRRGQLEEMIHTLRREFQHADIDLGFHYEASPGIVADGSAAPASDPDGHLYQPVARPGHRLPHAWLRRSGRDLHTHELVEPGHFLLLAGARGGEWLDAAVTVEQELGVAMTTLRVAPDGDVQDVNGAWEALSGTDALGVVLARPDGHVVFRAPTRSPDAAEDLRSAFRVALGLGSGTTATSRPVIAGS